MTAVTKSSTRNRPQTALSVGKVLLVGLVVVLVAVPAAGCSAIVEKKLGDGFCGDGVKGPEEECDDQDFGDRDCTFYNGDGATGDLVCDHFCRIDQQHCMGGEGCGNNICEPGEYDEGCVEDCWSQDCWDGYCQYWENIDFCSEDCSGPIICGNGVREHGEDCDGDDLGGTTCEALGRGPGFLTCAGDCMIIAAGCAGICGDGFCELGEDIGNCAVDCHNNSCGDGTCDNWENDVTCPSDCQPITWCGNGIQEMGEECDGFDLGGWTCQAASHAPGDLQCNSNCGLDLYSCGPEFLCGDGARTDGEYCEGVNLDGQTCDSLGYGAGGGALVCNGDCTFRTAGCTPPSGAPDGAPCGGDIDCEGGICWRNDVHGYSMTDGYCTRRCDFGVCPWGGVCVHFGPGDQAPYCYSPCLDCRGGYDCYSPTPQSPDICWPPSPF